MARILGIALAGVAALALAGCDETGGFPFGAGTGQTASTTTRLVERDIEAPEVFQVSEQGLWDGRPSLGGVWVADANVQDPERVIIRNEANGQFVIGALFRRERTSPGPALQVSSDAADALGMLAGAPVQLNVTALRREEVPDAQTPSPAPAAAGEVSSETLQDTVEGAIAEAETNARPQGATPATPATAAATPAAAPATASTLSKPFIQIGIFSVEANARRTADRLRGAGMVPTVREQESRGRKFWRVVVGPTRTTTDRAALLQTAKGLGFADAYFVSN
ncbi:MAG: rare lipoprotein A [Polaromonas sp.]|jgi:cell division septation protein DedD